MKNLVVQETLTINRNGKLEIFKKIKTKEDIKNNMDKEGLGYFRSEDDVVIGTLKDCRKEKVYDCRGRRILKPEVAIIYPQEEEDGCTHAGYKLENIYNDNISYKLYGKVEK